MGEKVRRDQMTFWVCLQDGVESGDPVRRRNSSALEYFPHFCTTTNLQSAVVYLSQELQGMGLGCPLIETEGQRINLVALVNACWEVTQLYRASVRNTNALQDQHRRNIADINHFQISIKDLRGEVNEKERFIGEVQEKERRATIDSRSLAAKLKMEKEEVRRSSSFLQQQDAQHRHELKKKQMEIDHLKDRLHRLVSGGRSADIRKPTLSLPAPLSRANRSRGKWKTDASSARHEEELYKRVLARYEAWIGQLRDENEQLKSCLFRISSQMASVGKKYCKVETEELVDGDMNISMTSSAFSTDSLENFDTNLDFPAYKDRIQETFNDNMKAVIQFLEEALQKTNYNSEKQLKEELENLRKRLKATKEELAGYKFAIEKYDPEKAEEIESSFLVEGRNVEEEVSLEKERQNLMKEREILEKEKRIFTEATIKLNRERASFEAEKRKLLTEQFLQDLPATLKALGNHESGDLSSENISEVFDSTQFVVAVPNITVPSENITFIEGSSIVLGRSKLSKQQQKSSHCLPNRMSFGFKSAPTSRTPSSSRQSEEKLNTSQGHGIPPQSTRSHTLERTRRKSYSNSRSPLSKSKSQSQGNLVKDSNRGERETYNSEYFLDSTKVNLEHHKDYLDCVRRDRVYSGSQCYQTDQSEMSPYSKKDPCSPQGLDKVIRPDVHSQENLYDINSASCLAGNSSVDALEADLTELLEQQGWP